MRFKCPYKLVCIATETALILLLLFGGSRLINIDSVPKAVHTKILFGNLQIDMPPVKTAGFHAVHRNQEDYTNDERYGLTENSVQKANVHVWSIRDANGIVLSENSYLRSNYISFTLSDGFD